MLLKRHLLVGRRKQVGKDMADTMGLGTGEDMMVGGGGGRVIFSSHPQQPQQEYLTG